MPDDRPRRGGDPVTVAVMLAVLAVAGCGYLAFPWLLHTVQRFDCMATGRFTDC